MRTALVTVLLFLWPLLALAQGEPSAEEKETARSLFRRGDGQFQRGEYRKALESFKAADLIMRVPTTGLELGRTQMQLKMLVEARETLLRVTRLPRAADESDVMDEARAEAEQLAVELAGLIPTLKVELRGIPDSHSARVSLDGRSVAPAAIAAGVKVNPGSRILRAEAEGYITRERNIDVEERQERVVTMTMRALPPDADVDVVIDADEVRPAIARGSDAAVVAYISFGVAGAGFIIGAITGALTLNKEAKLEAACPEGICPPAEQENLDEAGTLGEVSTGAFVAGGVAGLLGIVAISIAVSSDREQDVALSFVPPGVGPYLKGPGGMVLRGSF